MWLPSVLELEAVRSRRALQRPKREALTPDASAEAKALSEEKAVLRIGLNGSGCKIRHKFWYDRRHEYS